MKTTSLTGVVKAHIATPGRIRWWLASLGTAAALLSTLILLSFVSEAPFALSHAPPQMHLHDRAAIAIRDEVNKYQQWGSMLFTYPMLKQGYHRVFYFNQMHSDEDQKDAIIETLKHTLKNYKYTDLFLTIHGSDRYLRWIQKNIPFTLSRKLRLVYSTGCGDAKQGPKWRALGATAYVGHPGKISVSPIFYFYFLRRWVHGYPLNRALHEANWYTHQHLLLLGRLSFGLLRGPHLSRDTHAILYGPSNLHIDAAPPTLLSSQCVNRLDAKGRGVDASNAPCPYSPSSSHASPNAPTHPM